MTKVRLYDLNMNEIYLRGVKWLEFVPEPVTADQYTEKVYNGEIDLGESTNARRINARFSYDSFDYLDHKLLRNELYSIFSPLNKMWAVDEDVPGIKWLVKIESYQPERINGTLAEVSLTFKSSKTYARSIGDSLDPYTFESGLWSYGMGLMEDASTQDYSHETTSFSIHNPSNVTIDPREDELRIMLYYSGASVLGMEIINDTTGDKWTYSGTVVNGDVITLDGVVAEKNTVNIVGDTNLNLLKLAKGTNNFRIIGLNGSFEIFFKFPFLYV